MIATRPGRQADIVPARHIARGQDTAAGGGERSIAPLAIALATAVAGLGVQAAVHAWLARRRSPLVAQHRATLTFLSALVGDGLVLPGVNAALAVQLRRWGVALCPARVLRALAAGAGITAAVHVTQGWLGLVNWSMPRPFVWNWIGWYHALFMCSECTYLAYGSLAVADRWRAGRRDLPRLLGAALGGVLGFAVLVAYDYRPSDYRRGTR